MYLESVHPTASPPPAVLNFSAAMPWRNFGQLEAELYKRSDPKSDMYTEWMSMVRVLARVRGSDDAPRGVCAHPPEASS